MLNRNKTSATIIAHTSSLNFLEKHRWWAIGIGEFASRDSIDQPIIIDINHPFSVGEVHDTQTLDKSHVKLVVYLPISPAAAPPPRGPAAPKPPPPPPRFRLRSRKLRCRLLLLCRCCCWWCCCCCCCWWWYWCWWCCCCSCRGAIGPRDRALTPEADDPTRRADSFERRNTEDHSTSESSANRRHSSSPTWFSTSYTTSIN